MCKLVKNSDGWDLIDDNGESVLSGDYPLIEDPDFIQKASEKLDKIPTLKKPYDVVDNRHP